MNYINNLVKRLLFIKKSSLFYIKNNSNKKYLKGTKVVHANKLLYIHELEFINKLKMEDGKNVL